MSSHPCSPDKKNAVQEIAPAKYLCVVEQIWPTLTCTKSLARKLYTCKDDANDKKDYSLTCNEYLDDAFQMYLFLS